MSAGGKRPVPEVMLLRYLAGDLSEAERDQLEAERRSSPELAARIAELEREQAAYYEAHPPAAVAHQLWTRLSVEESQAVARRAPARWWRWFLLPSAATAAAVLFAVFVARESAHETPTLAERASPRSDVELAQEGARPPAVAAPEAGATTASPTDALAKASEGPEAKSTTVAPPAKPAAPVGVAPAQRARALLRDEDAAGAIGSASGPAFGDGGGAVGGGLAVGAPRGSASKGGGMGGGGGHGQGAQGLGRGASGVTAHGVRRSASKEERLVEREEPLRDTVSPEKAKAAPAEPDKRTYAAPPPAAPAQGELAEPAASEAASSRSVNQPDDPRPAVAPLPEPRPSSKAPSPAALADDAADVSGERARRAPPRPHGELVVRAGAEVRRSRGGTMSAGREDKVLVVAGVARDAEVLVVAARAGAPVQTMWRGRLAAGEDREFHVAWPPRAGEGPLHVFVIASDVPLDVAAVFPGAGSLPADYAGAIRAEPGSFVRLRLTARP